MTTPSRDEAREDAIQYTKALIANRTDVAIEIEHRWGVFGHTPMVVSLALQAATEGRNHLDAIDDYLEGSD